MSDREIFPIPTSGQTIIAKTGPQTFEVTCSGMNAIDHAQLPGLFCRMQGRFRAFRLVRGSVVHPHCRFDTDSPNFVQDGPDNYSVTLPIKILVE